MKFALVEVSDGGERLCAVVGGEGELYDLGGLLREAGADGGAADVPATPLEAARAMPEIREALEGALGDAALRARAALPDGAVRLLAPLPRPNRILAIGRNYAEHAKESGADVFEEPIVFLKASTSVVGPDAPIEIPEGLGRVDFEAELLVVLGKGGKNVSEADAMDLVVGYSVFNDVTAREVQRADQARKHPWFRSKSVDTFGPMGPYLVTADEVADPHALRVSLTVNGTTKQDDTTASMVYRIPTLIAFLSKWFALEPGDVIATGTPSGIGAIVPGDVVEATVEGVGALRNPVIAV